MRPGVCIAVTGRPEDYRITNPAEIFHIENATNLTRLPARGFTVVVAPLNTVGGSGGPARVFALLR